MHDTGGIVLNPAQGDETAALQFRASARRLKTLEVLVERRLRILLEDPMPATIPKKRRRPSVNIFPCAVVGLRFSQDDANQIMGISIIVSVRHRGRDLAGSQC